MGYYANISGSNVIQNIVSDSIPVSEGNWIEHSHMHVCDGFIYDSGIFYPPCPYEGWILNKDTLLWEDPNG
jgi:hypothetical protein